MLLGNAAILQHGMAVNLKNYPLGIAQNGRYFNKFGSQCVRFFCLAANCMCFPRKQCESVSVSYLMPKPQIMHTSFILHVTHVKFYCRNTLLKKSLLIPNDNPKINTSYILHVTHETFVIIMYKNLLNMKYYCRNPLFKKYKHC